MRKTSIASLALLAVLPVSGFAWSPYGPEPVPQAQYGYPGPYGPTQGMPASPWGPGYPGYWTPAAPEAETGTERQAPPGASAGAPNLGSSPGGYGRPLGAMPRIPRIDISRQMEGEDYVIDIRVQNIDPEQLEIRPQRRGLLISYDKSVQTNESQQLAGGDGYRRSYSISRGTVSRRVGLPADAKLDAMSREQGDGHIRLRIPRDTSAPGAHW